MSFRLLPFAGPTHAAVALLLAGCAAAQPPEADTGTAQLPNRVLQQVQPNAGEDWPMFLGPREDGTSLETGLLEAWPPAGPPIVWERSVGTGYSAPSIRNGQLVVHHRLRNDSIVSCVNAYDGSPIWEYRYPSNFTDPYGYNNGPRCSPLLTDKFCITLGAEGKLLCLNSSDGSLCWQHDLHDEFRIPEGFFGVGSSPVLEGEKVIVMVGGQPNSGVVAFDLSTGKVLWENVGKSTWDGAETGWGENDRHVWDEEEMVVSYSSPLVVTIHGQRHALCLMRQGLVSLDPETGRERFHFWFRPRVHESVNAARPVVVGDTILLSAAYRLGSALLKVRPDGESYDVVWTSATNLLAHWTTPIHLDGCYYGFSGRHENEGELRCIEAATGAVLWKTTGWEQPTTQLRQRANGTIYNAETQEEIPWPFYGRGSAILAEGKLIVLAERGTLALVEVSRNGWKEISRCAAPGMTYPSWAAPVLSHGLLYLRDEDSLICLNLRRPE